MVVKINLGINAVAVVVQKTVPCRATRLARMKRMNSSSSTRAPLPECEKLAVQIFFFLP